MPTHCTVKFYNEDSEDEIILSVYHQYDGHTKGKELAEWLKNKKIVQGVGNRSLESGEANGMGCLAAQYLAQHKDCVGSVYCCSNDTTDERYNYKIKFIDNQFIIEIIEEEDVVNQIVETKVKFRGTIDELIEYSIWLVP